MFDGALVALITPFKNNQIDYNTLYDLIEFQIKNNTNGIVPCGTTGESATLSHNEHKSVIKATVDAVNKRIPVIAGAGSNSTQEAIDLTLYSKNIGADGALHITPYYNKPTQEGIYRHFEAITKASSGFPIIPYNIPSRTGINITPSTIARIANLPGVVAVKEASGNINQVTEIINLCKDKLTILSGDDNMLLPLLSIGAKGIISVVNNIVPHDVAEIINNWKIGHIIEAQQRFYQLLPLCKAMFIETNPVPVKTAMAILKMIPNEEVRLPMYKMSPDNRNKLLEALTIYGLLT